MATIWQYRQIPFTIDTYDSDSEYDADEMYDGLWLTQYSSRTVPTTSYLWRDDVWLYYLLDVGDWTYLMANDTTFLFLSDPVYWTYTGRIIP